MEGEDWRTARAVAFGAGAQLASKALSLGLNVVIGLALIRYFGTAEYGDYVFVLSFASLFGLLSDLGIAKIAVRDISRRPELSASILGTAVCLRLGLCIVSVGLAQVGLLAIGSRPELRPAVAVASTLYVTDALLSVVVVFQVHLANQYEALVSLVVQILDAVVTLFLISQGAGILAILAAPVACGFIGVALAMLIARNRFNTNLVFDSALLPALATAALPLGITALLATLYIKIDSVLLGILATPSDVGVYGAGYKPIEYLLLVGAMLVQLMFPLLARWHQRDPHRFLTVYRRGAQGLLALVLPVPIVAAVIAEPLILTMYARDFAASVMPLRVLSVALVLLVLSSWQSFALLAAGRQRIALIYDAGALVINVVLNISLILWLGYMGAAITAVVTAAFLCVAATYTAWRVLHVTLDVMGLLRVGLANVMLGGTLLLSMSAGVPWLLATVIAGLCYPLWLLICRVATPSEVRLVLRGRGIQNAEAMA